MTSLLALAFGALTVLFQNCSGMSSVGLSSEDVVLIKNPPKNLSVGDLKASIVDAVGARELAVPEDNTIVVGVTYRVTLEIPSEFAAGSSSVWTIHSTPQDLCALELVASEPDSRLLTCVQPAQIVLRIEVQQSGAAPVVLTLKKAVAFSRDLVPEGQRLFAAKCAACHGMTPDERARGASVTKIDDAFMNVGPMRDFAILAPTEVRALSAYLMSLEPVPTATPVATATPVGTPPPGPDGNKLYEQNCKSCHGDLATSTKRGFTAAQIRNAINTKPAMSGLKSLTNAQIAAIAKALGAGQPTPTATPNPTATPQATPPPSSSGAALYAKHCAGCHGPIETTDRRGASAAKISAAIGSITAMKSLKTLKASEIAAIAAALGVGSVNATPVSPGFRFLYDRFEMFTTNAGNTSTDKAVKAALNRSILEPMEFLGGTCSSYQDPKMCAFNFEQFAIVAGARMNPTVSTIRRGYVTRTCDEVVSKAPAVDVLMDRRGLADNAPFTDANVAKVFNAFVSGRTPTQTVVDALSDLGTKAQQKTGKAATGWQFIIHTLCVSPAADLL